MKFHILNDDMRAPTWSSIERNRRDIRKRKEQLEAEIREREGEIRNLDWEWEQTCAEADALLDSLPILRRQAL